MRSFITRVTAYHGEPKLIGTVPVRAGVSVDTPVPFSERDMDSVDLDELIRVFEDSHRCKVAFGEELDTVHDGIKVYEFDIFEPSWKEPARAREVIDELTHVLVGWTKGFELL